MQGAKTSSAPRLIAAVYSGDPSRAEVAYRKLRGAKLGPVAWLKPDGSVVGDPGQPILRLEGEALVAVRVKPPFVQTAIDILQSAGAPTIFFLPTKVDERPEPGPHREPVLTRLRDSKIALDEAQHELLQALQLEHALSPSAEWLLDNFHLAMMQIAEMRRDVPKGFGKRNSPGEADGYLYACGLTRKLIQMTDHSVQGSTIQDVLTESQKTRPLTIAQLWSFPLLLRLALVEELAAFATRVSQNQLIREAAYFWANRLIVSARRDSETLDSSLAAMEENSLSPNPYFITCLAEQLQDEEAALARIQHWLERLPTSSLEGMVRSEHNREAAECVSISNAFGSLRTLARVDFAAIFEATSLTEAELRADPTGVYQRSDFTTRNRCRHVVERLG
ncbi:MAG TPA: hypothetical protein VNH18_28915, partial [Bryobacteraceae bacterium]|nr:hypothetical protein [Bryobacteraceae bacterium]